MSIYKNLPEGDYNALSGIRSTTLTTIDRKTLAHAKYGIDVSSEDNADFSEGRAFHDLILRNNIFSKTWGICPPDTNFTTKEGKAVKAEMLSKYGDQYLKHEVYEKLLMMRSSILQNDYIKRCLDCISDTELTVQWESEVDGLEEPVLCKCRIDAVIKINGQTIIADLKTTKDASPKGFKNASASYGYFIQSAHYLEGAIEAGILDRGDTNFIHIVVEKSAPYLSALYVFDDASLEVGKERRNRAIKKYVEAEKSNEWEGYGDEPITLSAPDYYFNI